MPTPALYLALDLGDKRTGVASGDTVTRIVSPVDVIHAAPGPERLAAVLQLIAEHAPTAVVIGLPLNMDGTEGPAAQSARAFGEQLAAQGALPIHYHDERLTTFAADQSLARTGRTHKQKKNLRDALAAAHILTDFLQQLEP